MKRYQTMGLALLAAATAAASGCGDDETGTELTCGPGTTNVDGVCTAAPAVTCSGGTVLDAETNACVPSEDVCADGTVLAGSECVDPATLLDAAVEEAAEPNNFGIQGLEDSPDVAGTIALPAVDATVIVHGNIEPFQDLDGFDGNDADFDSYRITAAGPTLVEISTDGINGLQGAFLVSVPVDPDGLDPLSGFLRYGMSVVSDTSKRFVYLPAAGDYYLTVGDTRSMYIDGDSPPAAGFGGASGGPNADYYVSLTTRAIPAPTPLTLTGGTGQVTDTVTANGAPKFYSVEMGLGINNADLDIDGTPTGALVLSEGTDVRAAAQETAGFFGPELAATSVIGGDPSVLVVDFIHNYNESPTNFTLNVSAGTAAALSTSGGTATQPEDPNGQVSVFYYEVSAADEIKGIDISFNQPVVGVVVDQDFFIVANFTFNPASGFIDTFQDYTGLIRHRAAGRYYFFVGDPDETGPTSIVATSTIETVAAVAVTRGTPLTGQAVNAYGANPFSYVAGVAQAPWQTFHVQGQNTGARTANFFDADTAYGSLTEVEGDTTDLIPDVAPSFVKTFGQNSTPQGRILLGDTAERYLVTVETVNDTGTLTIDFAARTITDLGTLANGQSANPTNQQLTQAAPISYYLVRNAANVVNNISVDPTNALFDTRIAQLDANENQTGSFNSAGIGAADSAVILNSNGQYVAFAVTNGVTPVLQTEPYTISVSATNFAPGTYTRVAGTTQFADACGGGGTTVPLTDDGTGFGGSDDGLSAAVAAPAGFEFFGYPAGSFIVSSNGWLTFGSTRPTRGSEFSNADMPNTAVANAIVAPGWDDLYNIQVCTRTVGTTLVVQWTGLDFADDNDVEMQAILDGADGSIEFVYGPNHDQTGDQATVGIEDQAGSSANKVGFNQNNTTTGPGYLFTPN